MIAFMQKTDSQSKGTPEAERDDAERIRKAAVDRSKHADTDGTRRRARQTADDNRLI